MKKYRFTIPGRLPGLNEILDAKGDVYYVGNGKRRSRYTDMKKEEQDRVIKWLIAYKIPKNLDKISLEFFWYEPNRKRDPDNIRAGEKFIWDALKQYGSIPNDNWKHTGYVIHHEPILDKDNPRVEVIIIPHKEK